MSTETIMKIINMVVSCSIWAALFILFFYITKSTGMTKNLPKESKKRLGVLKKYVDSFIKKVSDDKEDSEKSLVRCVRKLKFLQRTATKIFAVFVYEHPDVREYQNVLDSYHRMYDECKKISIDIAEKKYEKIKDSLTTILHDIDKTDELLDIAIAKDSEEMILNA